jgi:hypothetical protein
MWVFSRFLVKKPLSTGFPGVSRCAKPLFMPREWAFCSTAVPAQERAQGAFRRRQAGKEASLDLPKGHI